MRENGRHIYRLKKKKEPKEKKVLKIWRGEGLLEQDIKDTRS